MQYLEYANRIQGEAPERLIVCLDVSPSMENTDWPPSRLAAAMEATEALIERKRSIAPRDEVGVVTFSGHASVLSAPREVGRYAGELANAVRRAETGSATNITAGLQKAEPMLRPGRRRMLDRLFPSTSSTLTTPWVGRIVILTDGEHNFGPPVEYISERLKKAGVTIDCIGIGGDPSAVDEKLLREICSRHKDGITPRYSFIGDKSGLIEKFEELAGRITR